MSTGFVMGLFLRWLSIGYAYGYELERTLATSFVFTPPCRCAAWSSLHFDWFAVDPGGHLALCSTAGFGEVPQSVLRESTKQARPGDCIEELLRTLDVIGKARSEGPGPGSCEEWLALAKRGFFIYDWQHWDGPYTTIVRPTQPAVVASVPAQLLRKLHPISTRFMFKAALAFSLRTGTPELVTMRR